MTMTEAALRNICRDSDLYSTPELNEALYCNFQGFTQIAGLERYTSLRSLFLEGNALDSLVGLPACDLKCLYVQNNQLECLRGLENVPSLQVLNVSSNKLTSLAGLSACPQLQTLIGSNNKLSSLSSVSELACCPELGTLDLQSNSLDDPEVLNLVKALPAVCGLYIKENPFLETVRHCRKTLVGSMPKLTYMDDRPVFDIEHVCAEAWLAGGLVAEQKAREQFQAKAQEEESANFEALQAIRRESFRKRRESLGLPAGDTDPFYDNLFTEDPEEPSEPDEPMELRIAPKEKLAAIEEEASARDMKGSNHAAATLLSEELSGPAFADVSAQDLQQGSLNAGQTMDATSACVQPSTAAAILGAGYPQGSHDAQAAVQPTANLSPCFTADGGQCPKPMKAGVLDLIVNSTKPSDVNSTVTQNVSESSSIAGNADPGISLEVQQQPPSDAALEALAVASVCSSSLEEMVPDEDGSESDWHDCETPAAQGQPEVAECVAAELLVIGHGINKLAHGDNTT